VCHAADRPEGNGIDAGDAVLTVPSEQRVHKVVLKKVVLTTTRMAAQKTGMMVGWRRCSITAARCTRKTFYLGKRENIYLFLLFFQFEYSNLQFCRI
jgi:hypothetical protein